MNSLLVPSAWPAFDAIRGSGPILRAIGRFGPWRPFCRRCCASPDGTIPRIPAIKDANMFNERSTPPRRFESSLSRRSRKQRQLIRTRRFVLEALEPRQMLFGTPLGLTGLCALPLDGFGQDHDP